MDRHFERQLAAANAQGRQLAYWSQAWMLTIGLHLAALGMLAKCHWSQGLMAPHKPQPALEVHWTAEPEERLAPQIVLRPPVRPPIPTRLSQAKQTGVPDESRSSLSSPEIDRRHLSMEPARQRTPQTEFPLERAPLAALRPSVGRASLPAGVPGEAAESAPGAAMGECVVFVYDNSLRGEVAHRMRRALARQLAALDPQQYFYVVAFDGNARRMFSEHSPELRPVPPTDYNRWLTTRWLETLAEGESTDGANWAVVHAIQMRPASVRIFCGTHWPERASAYLRSVNVGADQRPRIPVHVLAPELNDALRHLARDNGGTCEALSELSARVAR